MTDITISEALSEFRKLARAFKALEHAEAVLEALNEKNVLEKEVDAKVKELSSVKEVLEKDVGELIEKVNTLTNSLKELTSEYNETKVAKTAEAVQIVNEAKRKAEVILSAADKTVALMQGEISDLKSKKDALISEVQSVKKELESVQNKIATEKRKMIEALGG